MWMCNRVNVKFLYGVSLQYFGKEMDFFFKEEDGSFACCSEQTMSSQRVSTSSCGETFHDETWGLFYPEFRVKHGCERLFVTPWPMQPMGFSRPEYWSG